MWILQVAEVKLPMPLLIALGIFAIGMIVYGSIPIVTVVLGKIRRLKLRNPLVFAPSMENTTRDEVHIHKSNVPKYSLETTITLDSLISNGEALTSLMQEPDFEIYTTANMGEEVRKWLDNVDHDIWKVVPEHASEIVATQGDLTPDEKLRYQGWSYENASLRVSVDRRLLRLRETRSQIQVLDSGKEYKDALGNIILGGRRRDSLQIQKAYNPWRIMYPIFLRNTRPIPIHIAVCTTTILWDDSPIQRVTWKIPEAEWSNGIPVRPNNEPVEGLIIPADTPYTLHVPLNINQVSHPPAKSPKWCLKGTICCQCGDEKRSIQFDFNTDYYEITQKEWQEWLVQVDSRL